MYEKREINGFECTILRKKVKNIIIRVQIGGEVVVSCGKKVSKEQLENAVSKAEKFIIKEKERAKEAEKNMAEINFEAEECREEFEYILSLCLEKMQGIKKDRPLMKIKFLRSMWGSCNRNKNSITLNAFLHILPKEYLEYVIIHELCHFIYFDHSANFWELVGRYCPNYKEMRRYLKENSFITQKRTA